MAALGVALAVALAGYGVFVGLTTPSGPSTLVVYSYDSFLGGGCGAPGSSANDAVLGGFERTEHAHVVVICPSGNLVSTLVAEANAPGADVVLGLDEITGPQAVADGVLVPYQPHGLSDVPSDLSTVLGGAGYLTPYEFGYLAIDYNDSFRERTHDGVLNWSFPATAANSSWAGGLIIENPTVDITGEEFLLWEIAFYQQVLHQDWRSFWQATDPYLAVAPDWTTAFTEFQTPPGNPPMVVSYSTDPAYAAVNGGSGFNSTVGRWNGSTYGWQTIYGAGIVKGTSHLTLAQKFVDWCLRGPVQSELPLTEWQYPANRTVALPPSFALAVDPGSIHSLDPPGATADLAGALPGYLEEWQSIANRYG